MRPIVRTRHVDLTPTQSASARSNSRKRGRSKERMAQPLALRGRLVRISSAGFLKRWRTVNGCPTFRSVQQIARPIAVERNGPNSISARSLEQEWLKQHHAEYAGAWVAIEGASLVAHGSSAREVLDAAKAEGWEQPLVVHIPKEPELPFGGW